MRFAMDAGNVVRSLSGKLSLCRDWQLKSCYWNKEESECDFSLSFLYVAFGFNPLKLPTLWPEDQVIKSFWLTTIFN